MKTLGDTFARDSGSNFNFMKTSVNARPPQRMNQPPALTEGPQDFVFEYNFDENGALYFLGSLGRRRLWMNPHQLG